MRRGRKGDGREGKGGERVVLQEMPEGDGPGLMQV